jgi:hypothetical protein
MDVDGLVVGSSVTERDNNNKFKFVTMDVAPRDELISVLSFTTLLKCAGPSPLSYSTAGFKPDDSPSRTGRWLAFTRM